MLQLIGKSQQLTDIQPCLNKHANMTLVAVPGRESRSVIDRDWTTLLRNSANNMLTRPPHDGPRANFANNHCAMESPISLRSGQKERARSERSPYERPVALRQDEIWNQQSHKAARFISSKRG